MWRMVEMVEAEASYEEWVRTSPEDPRNAKLTADTQAAYLESVRSPEAHSDFLVAYLEWIRCAEVQANKDLGKEDILFHLRRAWLDGWRDGWLDGWSEARGI